MPLTSEQRRFITLFVMDGEYNFALTCVNMGIRPSEVHRWFENVDFKAAVRKAEGAILAASGYGPLRVLRDTAAIAHSDIGMIQAIEGDLSSLPRNVRVAIKKVKFGVMPGPDGEIVTFPKEIEMHDKAWALRQMAVWFGVGESPEAKAAQATKVEDGPKRITGMVIRPPLTADEKELEDLLK